MMRRPVCITGVGTVARPDAQSKLSREPLLIRLTQKPKISKRSMLYPQEGGLCRSPANPTHTAKLEWLVTKTYRGSR